MPQTGLSGTEDIDTLYSGVVYLKNTGISQASGALLWTGKHIITAAHFIDDISSLDQLEIGFNTAINIDDVEIASVTIHPGWDNDPSNYNFDIAIIELTSAVDTAIERYQIYRYFDEVNSIFTRVGYSSTIDPDTGLIINPDKQFHSGLNQYDITTDQINPLLGTDILEYYQLSYDFDNGSYEHDAYGRIFDINDPGTGADEIFSKHGDSGGPAFIDNKIAGIASYIFRYQDNVINPDITAQVDSSYGELASDSRLSKNADWIDTVVLDRYHLPAIPVTPEEVNLYPVEADLENTINYFLLEIEQPLTVESGVSFETFDGSANAGSDYISTSGVVVIPIGELSTVISVEIIADLIVEADETFGIRVFQPYGGIFPEGVTELLAEHTIIDNDVVLNISVDIIA
ncbi:MAG: trypsin-like serine protease [gamma proteobacterium symbiont of Taylorina sp.]|nr:trypsin-like serine protease [gamma proteobacterium symbiont of Taylorina sp.]